MKALPFKVPKTNKESFRVQIEDTDHFYHILHSHPEIQITYIVESKGTVLAGDYLGNFAPSELYVIGSGQPHVFKNEPMYFEKKENLTAQCISIFIHKEMFGQQFMMLPEVLPFKEFLMKTDKGIMFDNKVSKSIYPLIKSISEKEGMEKLIILFQILNVISSSSNYKFLSKTVSQNSFNEKEGKRMNDIYQFLLGESHRNISLNELAELANLTPNSFCRFFKNHTGKSYTRFLNEIRIGNASLLLQNSDKNISDICFETGFGNLSNFNRQFKNITGISPKQFREKLDITL
jgi:AraC-like DNA-binding protein